MTTTSPDRPGREGTDAELDALVPRSRPWHRVVGGVAAVGLLAAAWVSPAVLRPSLDGRDGAGGVTVPLPGDEVLQLTLVTPEALTPFTVEAVGDVPGAHVAGAWLVTGEAVADLATRVGAGRPADAEEALAAVPDLAAAVLPQRVPARSGEVGLLVHWVVDDCALALAEDVPTPPLVRVRTVVGATLQRPLPGLAGLDPTVLDAAEGPSACGR